MKPTLEILEERSLPSKAHVVLLDFTPPPSLGVAPFMRPWQGGDGWDVNGDLKSNLQDCLAAEHLILQRTRALFAGLGWTVRGADWTYQTDAGNRWLAKGVANPDTLVQVVYVCGRPPAKDGGATSGLLGLGYEAGPGVNFEGACVVFGGNMASLPIDYLVGFVGDACAHEVGHLNGLIHPKNQSAFLNLMNAQAGDDFAHIRISHQRVLTEEDTYQNAWQELVRGWTQPDVSIAGLPLL
jgi:hypothetical protein